MIPTFKKADIKLEYHTAKVHNNFNKKKDYATFFWEKSKKSHIFTPVRLFVTEMQQRKRHPPGKNMRLLRYKFV